jgi:hypothetical protein
MLRSSAFIIKFSFSLWPKFVRSTNQGSKAILVLKNEVFLNQVSKAILVYTLSGINQGLFLRNKRYQQGNENKTSLSQVFPPYPFPYPAGQREGVNS